MLLSSVTYTSLARPSLQPSDLDEICESSSDANAQSGITSLLVFNGTHFLHTLEGPESAVEALSERLRKDGRHTGFEIRDKRKIDARSFPGWPMEMVRVGPGFLQARDRIVDHLPDTVPEALRARLLRMTELISKIEFPS